MGPGRRCQPRFLAGGLSARSAAHSAHHPALYLQSIVEESAHVLEAATGQLMLFQPAHSILDVLWVHIDIGPGLAKSSSHKSRQPVQGEEDAQEKWPTVRMLLY